ncbi:MAG: ornithine carbamoyltransferase [Candidatus Methanofastidiosia archaeon]
MVDLKGRHLKSLADFKREELFEVLKKAKALKMKQEIGEEHPLLHEKSLAMIFQKPSNRTRVSFEVGMTQLGGHALYLGPEDIQLGKREAVKDISRVLSCYVEGIMARVFSHQHIEELSKYSKVPVINGLSDKFHPCQALSDFLTIHEKKNTFDLKLCYVGDGNNVCHSLMFAASKLKTQMSIACPKGYEPDEDVVEIAQRHGLQLEIERDPKKAVLNADVIYTDVWVSMGQEEEKKKRLKAFKRYQVNMKLLKEAKKDVIFMHCLPAHRGEEVTEEVIESPYSVVFDQAENRLHAQKGLLVSIL